MTTDTDLHDLLARVAGSTPAPADLTVGVHGSRRRAARRRVLARVTMAAVVVAAATVGAHATQGARTARVAAVGGHDLVKGPPSWPDARLAPPLVTPVARYRGQDLRLDPVPVDYVPAVSAAQAYAACATKAACDRWGGEVLTLASITFDGLSLQGAVARLDQRAAWLIAKPLRQCSAAGPGAGLPVAPITHTCSLVVIVDAGTGEVLSQTVA